MKAKIYKLFVFSILASFILNACGLLNQAVPTETVADIPVQEVVQESAATDEPIVHQTFPSAPEKNLGNASDNDEITSFERRDVDFGDDFLRNRFERPFTVEMGDYIPEIDIVKFSIGEDDNFFYVTLTIGGLATAAQPPSGYYAIEVDGNIDGRGEFLVVANPPYTSDWKVDGVQIFIDENIDLGGDNPTRSDANYAGDGYEKLVFDSGRGVDPDLGWVRFVDGPTPAIELAFSKVIFPSTPRFMWSVWASATPFETAKFNLHDTTTEDLAGSPDKQNTFYPIKGIAGLDNSCRVPVGFTATGTEPLGCPVAGVDEKEPSGTRPPGICQLYPILCNPIIFFPIYNPPPVP